MQGIYRLSRYTKKSNAISEIEIERQKSGYVKIPKCMDVVCYGYTPLSKYDVITFILTR